MVFSDGGPTLVDEVDSTFEPSSVLWEKTELWGSFVSSESSDVGATVAGGERFSS